MAIEIPISIARIIRILSLPYNEQVCRFPDYVEIPDELALAFEEVTAPVFSSQLSLSIDIISDLKRLDGMIENISGDRNEMFWTMEALENSKEWSLIRACAVEFCLKYGIDQNFDTPSEWYFLREGVPPA